MENEGEKPLAAAIRDWMKRTDVKGDALLFTVLALLQFAGGLEEDASVAIVTYAPLEGLAGIMHCNECTVRRRLSRLKELGYLTWVRRQRGQHAPNVYTLLSNVYVDARSRNAKAHAKAVQPMATQRLARQELPRLDRANENLDCAIGVLDCAIGVLDRAPTSPTRFFQGYRGEVLRVTEKSNPPLSLRSDQTQQQTQNPKPLDIEEKRRIEKEKLAEWLKAHPEVQ